MFFVHFFKKKEHLLLLLLLLLFIVVRSIHFSYHLNFSSDQAEHATAVLQLFQDKKITLIGNPITSVQYQGHLLFQGPAYYYMMLIFLVLGNFDPIVSSYLFMLFCALMLVPLYYGVKMLINQKSALIIGIIYTLLPYYANYTRFHWNPNYQFSLLPLLIFLMGLYQKKPSAKLFFALSFFIGVLLQFHYQFLFVVIGIFIYYFSVKRIKLFNVIYFCGGILLGLLPLLIFEVKNQFYTIKTLLLFWQYRDHLQVAGGPTTPHYYLVYSFMLLLLFLGLCSLIFLSLQKKYPAVKKLLSQKLYMLFAIVLSLVLFTWSLISFVPKPTKSFWSFAKQWNYLNQKKVYDIIKTQQVSNYNVADLTSYDNKASVVKYLLKRNGVTINYDDYFHNKYLYVIYKKNVKNLTKNTPYEVSVFHPYELINTWKLNDKYSLYLLQRGSKK